MSETEGKRDWRIGLSVKVKYRWHDLYYEPPHTVVDVFPSGHGGVTDKDGVLLLRGIEGNTFLAPADQWRTA